MSEWIKILVSAVVGMTSGLVAEPLRIEVVRYFTSKRARNAIYREFADIYHLVVVIGKESDFRESFMKLIIEDMKTEVFDFYYDQHREAIYKIPEWKHLKGLSESI